MGSATRYLVNAAIKDGQRLLALERELATKATPADTEAFRKREIRAAIYACVGPLLIACWAFFNVVITGMPNGAALIFMAVSWGITFQAIRPSRVRDLYRIQRENQGNQK